MLWGFTSPCVAPLRHLGLCGVLPRPLPGLSPGLGVCPLPGTHHLAEALKQDGCPGGNGGFCRLGRVLSQVTVRTMSPLCAC